MNNIYENGAYQELARGFGVKDYTDMFNPQKPMKLDLKLQRNLEEVI